MATFRDLAIAVVVGYVAIAAIVWFAQERLLFYRAPRSDSGRATGMALEEVRFRRADGTG